MSSFDQLRISAGRHAVPALRHMAMAAALMFAGMAAAGCDKSPRVADELHPMLTDPKKRHPIRVVADTATLNLGATSDTSREAVMHLDATRFMTKYMQEGNGPLDVWVGSGSARLVAARLRVVRSAAREAGVPASAMRLREWARSRGPVQAVVLSYERVIAEAPVCGDWSEDTANDREKLPYPNYGCASQRNLAAMVARPSDFIHPAPEVARGNERRGNDYRTFAKGQSAGASSGSGGAQPAAASAAAPSGAAPATN